jgi:S1-C subfamily serine protease
VRLAIALIGCAAQTPTTQADQQASPSFRVAKLYDKQKYYRAAVIYYNEVIRQQPGSEESKEAKKRIDQLRAKFGDAALQPAIPVSPASKLTVEQMRTAGALERARTAAAMTSVRPTNQQAEQAAKARREADLRSRAYEAAYEAGKAAGRRLRVGEQAHPEYHKPRRVPSEGSDSSSTGIMQTHPESSGTGFFITDDGYLITNKHVAGNGAQVRLVTSAGLIPAKVVKVDATNDLALLKAEGKFAVLPVAASRSMKLGGTVATVGFPNIGLQGFAPKFARGEIGSLSGLKDDARYFQISVPVQPGNSGGALVDERGNVVGVVSAKLGAKAALATSGALPENVNYAVKSSFLLGFLESVPEIAAKLKEPNAKDMEFDDVVEQAKEAAVLVLVY